MLAGRRVGHRPRSARDRARDDDPGEARDRSARGPDRRVRSPPADAGQGRSTNGRAPPRSPVPRRRRPSQVLASNRGLEAKIAKRLEGAASSLRPAEWLLVHGGIAMVTALLFLLLSGGNVILLAVGLRGRRLAAVVLPRLQGQAADQGVQGRTARHAPADVGQPLGRPVAGPVDRHDRARGHRADHRRSSSACSSRAGSASRSRTRWRASRSGWRARTSTGS